MDREKEIENRIRQLGDKELNKLALHLKLPTANNGNQAPLGIPVTQHQIEIFIKWIKKTGNIDNAGIYLGILPDPDLPAREQEADRQRKLDQAVIDQANASKNRAKVAWIALWVSVATIIISIIIALLK